LRCISSRQTAMFPMDTFNALLEEEWSEIENGSIRRHDLKTAVAELDSSLETCRDLREAAEETAARYSFRLNRYEESLGEALDGNDNLESLFLNVRELQAAGQEAAAADTDRQNSHQAACCMLDQVQSILTGLYAVQPPARKEHEIDEARSFLGGLDGELNRMAYSPLRRNSRASGRLRYIA
jgi:outer membrane murein-binding lipoprotein Lpp